MKSSSATIETYPVPSFFRPIAFISRARLPSFYDMVFGGHARYPVEYVEIAKTPWSARRTVIKRAERHILYPQFVQKDSSSYSPEFAHLLAVDTMKRVLSGRDPMTPLWQNQKLWASMLTPDAPFPLEEARVEDVWKLLVAYNLPLIKEFSTKAQYEGIERLGLTSATPPSLDEIDERLKNSCGWRIKPMDKELEPRHFFSLLAQKQFPVVPKLRPLHAIFCGFEPDLWHEMVGHLSILTDPEYSDFYQWCGITAEGIAKKPNTSKQLEQFYKVLWVVLEYGIIKNKSDEREAFGGALTSSYMALQRLKHGLITSILFDPPLVLRSGIADELPAKRKKGKISLFHLPSLYFAKKSIGRWINSIV